MQDFDQKIFLKNFRFAIPEPPRREVTALSHTLPRPSPCFQTPNIFDAPPPLDFSGQVEQHFSVCL